MTFPASVVSHHGSFASLLLSRLRFWSQVSALGFVSVFDQVLEGLPQKVQDELFTAYMSALDEDGPRFRKDATEWEEWAKTLSGTRCFWISVCLCPTVTVLIKKALNIVNCTVCVSPLNLAAAARRGLTAFCFQRIRYGYVLL